MISESSESDASSESVPMEVSDQSDELRRKLSPNSRVVSTSSFKFCHTFTYSEYYLLCANRCSTPTITNVIV